MTHVFEQIRYEALNARQKENYNFQKVSALLADYGFITIKLSDDWQGADFIAQHLSGTTLKVQLKSRLTVGRKYQGKEIWVCFRQEQDWYFFPHDDVLAILLAETTMEQTESWVTYGEYSFPYLTTKIKEIIAPYRLVYTVAK